MLQSRTENIRWRCYRNKKYGINPGKNSFYNRAKSNLTDMKSKNQCPKKKKKIKTNQQNIKEPMKISVLYKRQRAYFDSWLLLPAQKLSGTACSVQKCLTHLEAPESVIHKPPPHFLYIQYSSENRPVTKLILISQYQKFQKTLIPEQALVLINRCPHLVLLRKGSLWPSTQISSRDRDRLISSLMPHNPKNVLKISAITDRS